MHAISCTKHTPYNDVIRDNNCNIVIHVATVVPASSTCRLRYQLSGRLYWKLQSRLDVYGCATDASDGGQKLNHRITRCVLSVRHTQQTSSAITL